MGRLGWQKAAGAGVMVWMTLQSAHMPNRCHVSQLGEQWPWTQAALKEYAA